MKPVRVIPVSAVLSRVPYGYVFLHMARIRERYGTQTYGTQIPEVRARAAARGPARSIQPGHIEFGTGDWSLSVCFDGNRFRHGAHGKFR